MISKRLSRQAESSSQHRQPQEPHLPPSPHHAMLLLPATDPRRPCGALCGTQQPCERCKEEGQGQGLVTFKLCEGSTVPGAFYSPA